MLNLLKELCTARGVSGDESEIAAVIARCFESYELDNMGNLLCFKEGKNHSKHILVAAHMDEVGFIISGIHKDGLLKFMPVGGIDKRTILGKKVLVGPKRVAGVIGCKALHLSNEKEKSKAPDFEKLFIDLGFENADIKKGDTVVFDRDFTTLLDTKVCSPSLDNRVGCLAAILAAGDTPYYDTTFAFTVSEEIGLRGAYAAANRVAPDFAIVVDTTTAVDLPGRRSHEVGCRLGEGTAIFMIDGVTYYDRETVKKAEEIAARESIKYQLKTFITGGVDAGAIQRSRGGIKTLTIATPCRYLHSPSSLGDIGDINETVRLLKALLASEDLI